ncbi:mediator complex subunit MED14-domain-containing protein [Lipomyces oligophaga]|uniref:mediator complex subunit MED14-domain-containing protein n=1 Tax=Lipomyces oligophaga TaxID=45792 RepID=UPI0034CE45FB
MSENDIDQSHDKLKQVVAPTLKESVTPSNATQAYPMIPHITENFIPLSTVVSTLTDNTYTELMNLLDALPGSNDLSKKRELLNFIIHTRQQYIKLLVLTQWSRNAKDISRVIDVVAWLHGQSNCFGNAVMQLQLVKRSLGAARLRNPDIVTALEVFVLGEPRLSTFNLVPPKKLSSQQILKVLHDLNILLSLRLALSSEIPPKFQKYTITNGRATFSVPGDFEIDLAIASEEPNGQFFLIDYRFNFKPEVKVTESTRRMLETVSNNVLGKSGLSGLYNFLHGFTLAFKLLVLGQQITKLANGVWTGTVSINFHSERQAIVLHYWIEHPGRRSSAEFGILQSKRLGVRWMPREFAHEIFSIDEDVLSAPSVFSQILTYHIQRVLATIYNAYVSSSMYTDLPDLIVPVDDMKLKIRLTPSLSTELTVEHMTGRMVLQGSAEVVKPAEKLLNSQTDLNLAPQIICNLRHLSVQREIEELAKEADWDVVKVSNLRMDDARHNYGISVRQISTIRKHDWTRGWFVVASIADDAVKLWLSYLHPIDSGWKIGSKEPLEGEALEILYSKEKLSRLALIVSAQITFNVISQSFTARGIPHKVIAAPSDSATSFPILEFDWSVVSGWAKSAFRVHFCPLLSNLGSAGVVVTGEIEKSAALASVVSASNQDVEFDVQNGRFRLTFPVPPADKVLSLLIERLGRIERAVDFLTKLQALQLDVCDVSLDRISFMYGPGLNLAVCITTDAKMRLQLDATNPFIRIGFFVQEVLEVEGLEGLVKVLAATFPLMKVLSEVEVDNVFFLARSAQSFRLWYRNKRYSINIEIRKKFDRQLLLITDSGSQTAGCQTSDACKVIWDTAEPGVVPMGNGVACEIDVAEELILRVHKACLNG